MDERKREMERKSLEEVLDEVPYVYKNTYKPHPFITEIDLEEKRIFVVTDDGEKIEVRPEEEIYLNGEEYAHTEGERVRDVISYLEKLGKKPISIIVQERRCDTHNDVEHCKTVTYNLRYSE